ncbi:hypothetical protein A3K86_21645 [Photobacterium jeanii]|uniref:ChrR-like cupin domain-containing protein n=1 Tax=Photobacterium jeanii TaxID=858640 RepID=A0A178K4B8_9GAMM|nr:cupin domain-containing protein [Photobacterium jeanii]OAN11533.1 hypothetical protein A3K86_21645 [Photobacterium jeanii]PST91052.1 cupin [Photobacterium jeanii]
MLNMNFSTRLCINTTEMKWQQSPTAGVTRKPLEREAAESGHTTSIVRYAANSAFPEHHHPKGEEIYVLTGTFSDESGHYPAGSYLRNPPSSHHRPFSKEGCDIFVKLNQFAPDDSHPVRINTQAFTSDEPNSLFELHRHSNQACYLIQLQGAQAFNTQPFDCLLQPTPDTDTAAHHIQRTEVFVLEGALNNEQEHFSQGYWLRLPTPEHFMSAAGTTRLLLFYFFD